MAEREIIKKTKREIQHFDLNVKMGDVSSPNMTWALSSRMINGTVEKADRGKTDISLPT